MLNVEKILNILMIPMVDLTIHIQFKIEFKIQNLKYLYIYQFQNIVFHNGFLQIFKNKETLCSLGDESIKSQKKSKYHF